MRKTVILQNRDLEQLKELQNYYSELFKQKYSISETFREAVFQEWLEKIEVPRHNNELPFS